MTRELQICVNALDDIQGELEATQSDELLGFGLRRRYGKIGLRTLLEHVAASTGVSPESKNS